MWLRLSIPPPDYVCQSLLTVTPTPNVLAFICETGLVNNQSRTRTKYRSGRIRQPYNFSHSNGYEPWCFGDSGTIPHYAHLIIAPRPGFEPGTTRLTAECSTAELPRNVVSVVGIEPTPREGVAFEATVATFTPH